ncbi:MULTISPECIES: hypothetical protein [Streptomyces]|uniref:Uncharacterized protein n=1 Tax=Streptomyces microflavus TaxID=1919 RepID=A0A7H8MNU3_STRMI|nr:hypothetical protein [Streptomyces microflavus]QKW43798.1 hypothetical protein HUT09_15320 [Streptomyces microflavus]
MGTCKKALRPLGQSIQQLRQGRILDEAKVSADPVRLIRLFGIDDGTEMLYISAAHPEPTGRTLQ